MTTLLPGISVRPDDSLDSTARAKLLQDISALKGVTRAAFNTYGQEIIVQFERPSSVAEELRRLPGIAVHGLRPQF